MVTKVVAIITNIKDNSSNNTSNNNYYYCYNYYKNKTKYKIRLIISTITKVTMKAITVKMKITIDKKTKLIISVSKKIYPQMMPLS